MITPLHARLAMTALSLTAVELSTKIGVSSQTVAAFVSGKRGVNSKTVVAMENYFAENGVIFFFPSPEGGIGVRLPPQK